MTHGDSIADCDGREHNRCSACHGNSLFYRIDYLVQIHVARNYLIIGAYDPNQRTLHLLRCKP